MPYYVVDVASETIEGIETVEPAEGAYGPNKAVVFSTHHYEIGDDAGALVPTDDNFADVKSRILGSELASKTPAQIFALMQGRIDSWSSLAQAKADLRNWLPLLAAGIAWLYQNRND